MPTLVRLLLVLAVLAGMIYGAMIGMVTYLRPEPRTITQSVTLPQGRH